MPGRPEWGWDTVERMSFVHSCDVLIAGGSTAALSAALTAAEVKMLSMCHIEARNKFMTDAARRLKLASHGDAAVAPGLGESMHQQQHQSSVV